MLRGIGKDRIDTLHAVQNLAIDRLATRSYQDDDRANNDATCEGDQHVRCQHGRPLPLGLHQSRLPSPAFHQLTVSNASGAF
jgi:hypothetical protein